ncbi:MAG TPA: hypothetical protein VMR48_06015 [Gaiellaceae bacterium]|nr:hypothetical protein [Gaiellaceae bacterium]
MYVLAVVTRSLWPTSSPIWPHGIPAKCGARRALKSWGENEGTPAAVQERAIAVLNRSPPTPWKTGRSGMRSSRATRPVTASPQVRRSISPIRMPVGSRTRAGSRNG